MFNLYFAALLCLLLRDQRTGLLVQHFELTLALDLATLCVHSGDLLHDFNHAPTGHIGTTPRITLSQRQSFGQENAQLFAACIRVESHGFCEVNDLESLDDAGVRQSFQYLLGLTRREIIRSQ